MRPTRRWIALALVLGAVGARSARAAVEHDRDDDGDAFDTGQVTFDATVGPGQDRYVVLGVTVAGTAATVTSARLGPTALDFIGAANAPASGCRLEWWGMPAPPEGTHAVVVQLAAATRHAGATLISYRGVDARNPVGTFVSAGGRAGPTAVTVTSARGGKVLDNVCGWAAETTIGLAGPGQTGRWHWKAAVSLSSAGSEKAGAKSVTMTWTVDRDGVMDWAAAGIALNPAGETAPQAPDAAVGGDADPGGGPVRLQIKSAGCSVAAVGPVGAGPLLAGAAVLLVLRTLRRRRPTIAELAPGLRV